MFVFRYRSHFGSRYIPNHCELAGLFGFVFSVLSAIDCYLNNRLLGGRDCSGSRLLSDAREFPLTQQFCQTLCLYFVTVAILAQGTFRTIANSRVCLFSCLVYHWQKIRSRKYPNNRPLGYPNNRSREYPNNRPLGDATVI